MSNGLNHAFIGLRHKAGPMEIITLLAVWPYQWLVKEEVIVNCDW